MPISNSISALAPEVAAWRRHLHAHPEIGYEVHETAAFVADKLKSFGCDEVVAGIGRTGVVGIIHGSRGPGRVIGLRADMDALPMQEETGLPHASTIPGRMHACGHDGHTAMLLGAAKHLADTRDFAGSVAVIFQPAEEDGAGGEAMVKDGLMDRFGIAEVYGMHNNPGLGLGQFATRPGPVMGATDEWVITVRAKGGHAAYPHEAIDPIVIGAQLVGLLQTFAARNADPMHAVVLSVTTFHAGTALNIIPETAELSGTIRTLSPTMRTLAVQRLHEMCAGLAAAHGIAIDVRHMQGYPVTVNDAGMTANALAAARAVAGDAAVDGDMPASLGAEDFSYMAEARPGAFIFIGNGDSAGVHHPMFDFNDDAIPHGIAYWAELVRQRLG
ncbi:MAG: M20 family metallopeptidase [Rhizobiaceae bacterium]|nr:M20 family metallopeptidase [Rhizobiaceae bacterium]